MTAKTIKKPKTQKKKTEHNSEEDPETIFRIYSILSYFIVLVIIGIPIWWYTTRVYRASLPLYEMYSYELGNNTDKEYGIPLSLEYDVLITFVNPDPSGLKVDIDGEVVEEHLNPFLSKISSIAEFIVKSQWLYLVELGAIPTKVNDHFALKEKQLPHIITPLEKKLGSHLSPRPCINLVVYFAHCRAPLYIYDNNETKSSTNAMISPRWGGVYIVNSDLESCNNKLFKPNVKEMVAVFQTQLLDLFKINGTSKEDIAAIEIKETMDLLNSTRRTLKSLAQLLSEINSIVISDDVAEKIKVAVEYADLTAGYLEQKEYKKALRTAKVAFSNSEEAFSDPSLLALLYFPDDQKYAVYIPLFLPVMIPVLMSLFSVKQWYRNKLLKKKIE